MERLPMVLLVLILIALSGRDASAGQGPPSPADALGEAYFQFIQAREKEDAGDAAGAIAAYREAVLRLPTSVELRTALADLYAREDRLADARTEAEAGLALAPTSRELHRLMGWTLARTVERGRADAGDPVLLRAIDHLERASGASASDPVVELPLVQLYLRNQEAPKAVARMERFLSTRADNPAGLRLLARAYALSGRTADVEKTTARLADVQPDLVELLVRQINQMERRGDWQEAAAAWADVIDRDPGAAIYRTRHANALANSGHLADARRVLRDATREAPNDIAAWYLTAVVEARRGDPATGEIAARQIQTIDPDDPRGPLAIGQMRELRGDYRGVIDVFEPRVVTPRPRDLQSGAYADMAGGLGRSLGALGEYDRAIRTLEAARKHAPDDQALLYSLAGAYERGREFDEAEKTFREIIAADPQNAQALNYLGYMLADRGRKLPEAVELITRALAMDKDNPSFLDSLGWAYFRLRQYDRAKDPLERAAAALPRVSVIQDHLGDLYYEMKQYAEAAAAFERALGGDRNDVDSNELTRKRDRARNRASKP